MSKLSKAARAQNDKSYMINKVFFEKAKALARKRDEFALETMQKHAKWILRCPSWLQFICLISIYKISKPLRHEGKIIYKIRYF